MSDLVAALEESEDRLEDRVDTPRVMTPHHQREYYRQLKEASRLGISGRETLSLGQQKLASLAAIYKLTLENTLRPEFPGIETEVQSRGPSLHPSPPGRTKTEGTSKLSPEVPAEGLQLNFYKTLSKANRLAELDLLREHASQQTEIVVESHDWVFESQCDPILQYMTRDLVEEGHLYTPRRELKERIMEEAEKHPRLREGSDYRPRR